MSDRRPLFADLPTRPNFSRPVEQSQDAEKDDLDDANGFYSVARGVRQFIPMLELRFASGNFRAFEYSMLEEVSFDPSKGITLSFGQCAVVIAGRHLQPIYAGMVRHAVRWVREAERSEAFEHAESETLTESIKILERQ